MEFKDYYETMGVARDATAADIKRAYRKLARRFHPDVSKEPDAEERFKELGEANAVLKDPEKRAAYDQLGSNWKAGQDFTAPPGWDAGFEFRGDGGPQFNNHEQFTNSSDFFESVFGQHFQQQGSDYRRSGVSPGADHHAKVAIDIEDAWHGAKREFTLQMPEIDASGQLQSRQRTISVSIPKGVKQGQHIRLTGLGEQSSLTGEPGNLYLEVTFNPHPLFRAEGHDLYLDLPVAPWEAALGARVKVPTPAGKIELSIPAGSATGKKLRVKGRGIPGPNPGDFYAVLRITLPPADTKSARDVYVNMRKELAFNPREKLGV